MILGLTGLICVLIFGACAKDPQLYRLPMPQYNYFGAGFGLMIISTITSGFVFAFQLGHMSVKDDRYDEWHDANAAQGIIINISFFWFCVALFVRIISFVHHKPTDSPESDFCDTHHFNLLRTRTYIYKHLLYNIFQKFTIKILDYAENILLTWRGHKFSIGVRYYHRQ